MGTIIQQNIIKEKGPVGPCVNFDAHKCDYFSIVSSMLLGVCAVPDDHRGSRAFLDLDGVDSFNDSPVF